ncbi:NAD(P)/FAD-dependent oxidoreductase [Haloarchaeobius iranensis]|uniref:Pyridine nucleotide-disulphide oxidoreductase n=1 Tax=Haloarchaeobius iranensis TaxID=996166 RepID=A0A1G9WZ52_9EURY|nr:FAD-dependent oxidoreductase [Haloarchaeobius iranensis]SDM89728.1 Pyridine nucleotide-disulphide oxidoreductase [Haloarchaeobius iranensis]
MTESYVIIGDGIAGGSAAKTLREESPDADITVITDEGEPLYNRILIKEYAKGKIPMEDPLFLHDEEWYEERDIALELNTHVTHIDPDGHVVHTHEGDDYEYDALLVATGGTPRQLPVDNSDADGVHHFWTFQDARGIADHAEESEKGIVVGAGLLGIDFAAICGARGIEANYLMRGDCWWRYALSEDGAGIIHDALRELDVEPVFQSGVDHFVTDDDGQVTGAVDPNGEEFEGEFVGVSIGLDFNTEFLRGSGIETDDGIVVDEFMETNVEDIYAAGDITRFYDVILEEHAQNGSWDSAKKQGAVAAKNMTAADGEAEEFRHVSSYSISHFKDLPFVSFGHPTIGDDDRERKYSDTEWRRLTFKNGKLIGGVLIGDLKLQSVFKRIIREERDLEGQKDLLLEEDFEMEMLEAPAQEQ